MIKLTIDGQTVEVPEGTTVLEAADKMNIRHSDVVPSPAVDAVRRLPPVRRGGRRLPHAADLVHHCRASNGMKMRTQTPALNEVARVHVVHAVQRAQSLLPVLPGQRRRLRTAELRLRRGDDPLAHSSPSGRSSRSIPRIRITCSTTTAAFCAAAVCAPAVNSWATSRSPSKSAARTTCSSPMWACRWATAPASSAARACRSAPPAR